MSLYKKLFLKMQQETIKIRAKLPIPLSFQGNVAIAYISIKGIPRKLKAHSSINDRKDLINLSDKGFVLLKKGKRKFTTSKVQLGLTGVYINRKFDTEAKILEYIAGFLGKNKLAQGEIYLFTEKKPCESCKKVIMEFRNEYNLIRLKVFWEKI